MDIVSCDLLQWIARIENGLKLRPTTRYTVKVKKSAPKSLSADCRYTVSQLLTNSIQPANWQLTNSKPTLKKLRSWEVYWHRRHSTLTVLFESVASSTANWAKIAPSYVLNKFIYEIAL